MDKDLIQGHCVEPRPHQALWLKPGEYGLDLVDGYWYARPPGIDPQTYVVANLAGHVITQHNDGTITASPSVEVRGHDGKGEVVQWHGYIEQGVWRQVP